MSDSSSPSPPPPAPPPSPSPPSPAPPPARARPVTRGMGLLAALGACALMGVADGVIALVRTPHGGVAGRLFVVVLAHCAAVCATIGLVVGLLEELVLESVRRTPAFGAAGAWLLAGPRRWFARDVPAARTTACVAIALAIALGPIFPVAYYGALRLDSPATASLFIAAAVVVLAALGAGVAVLLAAPLGAALARLGPLASPGAVATLALAITAAQSARFVRLNWHVYHALDFGLLAVVGALLVGNAAWLILLGRRAVARRRAPSWRVLALGAVAAVAACGVSGVTYDAQQTVAVSIARHSVLTRQLTRTLQNALDFDHDGYSALFGGGDCNDRDPAINPGALDVPRNGRDENCTGLDARPEVETSDGAMAPLPPALAAGPPPSVLFVSVDAMRPDHMSCYGYRRPTTPNIDAFAREGARFTNAYTASPRSLRSLSALWCGRYATRLAWGEDAQFPPLLPQNVTLAEQLRDAGYVTAAINNISYFSGTVGFYQGFDVQREGTYFKDDSAPAVAALTTFMRERAADGRPFFAWIHLMEAHDPYTDRNNPRDFGTAPVDLYDEGLAAADAALAPLFAEVETYGRARPVVTFVFADHGEAFGEHGVYHHSFDLHDEALRVPLIARGPGIAPGVRHELVSLLDLNPTALNLARRPSAVPVSGLSLLGPLTRPAPGELTPPGWRRELFGEVLPDGVFPSEQQSIYAPPYKLIHDLRAHTWELFDIARDRREVVNLFDERRDVATALRERLVTWTSMAPTTTNSAAYIAASRLPREPANMQHPMHVAFSDVMELLGYDVASERVAHGDELHFTFYYRVLRRTREPVSIVTDFDALDGSEVWPWFVARRHPLLGRYPTTTWLPGEILRDEVTMRVRTEVAPGAMRVLFGMQVDSSFAPIVPVRGARPDGLLALPTVIEVTRAPAP